MHALKISEWHKKIRKESASEKKSGLTYETVEYDLEGRSVTQYPLQTHARPAHARAHLLGHHCYLHSGDAFMNNVLIKDIAIAAFVLG